MFVRFIAAAIAFAQVNADGGREKQTTVLICAMNKVDSDLEHSFELEFEGFSSPTGSL